MNIAKFIADLAGLTNWTSQQKTIDDLVASRDWETIRRVGVGLAAAKGNAADGLFDSLVEGLALMPVLEAASLSIELTSGRKPPQARRLGPRTLAAMLAQAQTPETGIVLAERFRDQTEIVACFAQECVVRGKGSTRLTGLVAIGHPLRLLPPALLPIEDEISEALPQYRVRGLGAALPFGPGDSAGSPGRRVQGRRQPDDDRISAVVRAWCADSNGVFEAVVLESSREIVPAEFGAESLRSLLSCLADAERIAVHPVPPSRAVQSLFAAACCGGAYGRPTGGAYARLSLWESIAGLTGAGRDAAIAEAMHEAERSTWFQFDADGSWFQQVAWDLGVAVIRSDGRTVAALAATDTD